MAGRALLVLVALALAGCVQTEATRPAALPTHDVAAGSLALVDCRVHEAVLPVPIEEARAAMLPGFEPFEIAPGLAAFALGPTDCASHEIDGNDSGPARFGFAGFPALPPPERDDGSVTFHFVLVAAMSPTASLRDMLASWGAAVADGRLQIEAHAIPGVESSRAILGAEGFRAEVVGGAPIAADAEPSVYAVRFWYSDGAAAFDAYLGGRLSYTGPAASTSIEGPAFRVLPGGTTEFTRQTGTVVELRPVGAAAPDEFRAT